MQKITLKVELRNIIGRKVKSLRRQGFVPAVVYGHDFKPLTVQVPIKELERVYAEAGESTMVYLDVNGQDHLTIIHDVIRDALSDKFLHADFYRVRLDEKIHAKIQLNFMGEAPAVKNLNGILVKNMSEIEVEGLPQDLPHLIDVDISGLVGFRSHILVKDLALSNKLGVKVAPSAIVALIQEPISEEELKAQLETPAARGVEEVEVIKKEKPETTETQEENAQKEEKAPKENAEKK